MSTTTSTLSTLLRRFRFTNDVPENIREQIYVRKKSLLASVLREKNSYGIAYALVIWLFFLFRKSGIRISVVSCKIILASAILASSGSTSFAVYHYIARVKPVRVPNAHPAAVIQPADKPADSYITIVHPGKRPRLLSVDRFDVSVGDPGAFTNIHAKLFDALREKRMKGSVILGGGKGGNDADRVITGRVHRLGSRYVLTVKVVNTRDSSIQFSRTLYFTDISEVDTLIDSLSTELAGSAELWE